MTAALRAGCASLLLMVAGQGAAEDAAPEDAVLSDRIEGFEYGVYCADAPIDLERAPDTAAGVVNIVPDLPELRATTTLVPAQIGIGFGVLVTPADGEILAPVDITITHPPYPDSGITVERWQTRLEGGRTGLVGFSFEIETELVTGEWRFQAMHAEEMLFDLRFEVVPPALLPDLAQGCGGAMLS